MLNWVKSPRIKGETISKLLQFIVMICALILNVDMDQFDFSEEELKFYEEKRMLNGKGVIIPSQRRYIYY